MESPLISSLITTDFDIVDPSERLESVKSLLLEKKYLVVLEQGVFKGILHAESLINTNSPLISYCLKQTSFLKKSQNITSAIRAMEKDQCSVFPVANGQNQFIGVILQSRILQYLGEILSQTPEKQTFLIEKKREQIALLNIWHESTKAKELISRILEHLWIVSGSDAIGIRLEDEDYFPYCETRGFSDSFLQQESNMSCTKKQCHTSSCASTLECLCGQVLSGNYSATNKFFTSHGSFWCNDLGEYLRSLPDSAWQVKFRTRCLTEGFQSIALIPLKIGKSIKGLIQFNFTSCTALTLERVNMIEEFSQDIALAIANKKNEEILRYQNKRYFGIFETMPHLIIYLDSGGILIDCNSRIESLLGYAKEDVIGKNLNTLLHPDSIKKAFKGLLKIITGNHITNEEFQMLKQDGTIIDVRINSSLFPMDEKTASLRIVSIVEDITEYKRQQREREEMQNQIFLTAKLASIGELTAGVAHEINNPLAILQGNMEDMVEKLTERGLLDDWLKSTTKKQKEAIRRIAKIVRGLRIYSHTDKNTLKVFNMHRAIEDTILMVEPIYSKRGVTIIKKLCCPSPNIDANLGKFHQVIMNFLSNAYDSMINKKPKIIIIATEKYGNNAHITISDTGTGMSPDVQNRIFDTFFTTKPTGKGTGLGLSISYTLIKQMKGTILVDSTPGKGTSFTFTLPISEKKGDRKKLGHCVQ